MTERLPRLVFVTLALACSLAAPSTWAVTGKNSCRSPAGIVDADHQVVVPGVEDNDVWQALRPAFDTVWQSAGHQGSRNYNDEGEWAPPPIR